MKGAKRILFSFLAGWCDSSTMMRELSNYVVLPGPGKAFGIKPREEEGWEIFVGVRLRRPLAVMGRDTAQPQPSQAQSHSTRDAIVADREPCTAVARTIGSPRPTDLVICSQAASPTDRTSMPVFDEPSTAWPQPPSLLQDPCDRPVALSEAFCSLFSHSALFRVPCSVLGPGSDARTARRHHPRVWRP
jgi:hypothetical protein